MPRLRPQPVVGATRLEDGMSSERQRANHHLWYLAHREERRARDAAYYLAHRDEAAAQKAARYAAHRDEERAKRAAWYVLHRDEQKARATAYRLAYPEESKARGAAYYATHLGENKAYSVMYHVANRERIVARVKAWAVAHPDRRREYNRKGKAIRRGASVCTHESCRALGSHTLAWQVNPHTCYLCGTPVWPGVNLHMDHVVPISRGGIHCADNLRPACATCNLRKGTHVRSSVEADTEMMTLDLG